MTHLKPRSTVVVLYQGDDMDQLAHLKRRVDIARRRSEDESSSARFGDDEESVGIAQAAYDAFVDKAADRALEIELRSIGRRRFRDLLAEHPPRMVPQKVDGERRMGEIESVQFDGAGMVEHEEDAGWGVNVETFPEALLTYRDDDTVTIARPEFKNKAEVKAFVDDELAEGDYDQLWVAALMLNRSPSADPKAHSSLTASPSTDAT